MTWNTQFIKLYNFILNNFPIWQVFIKTNICGEW